MTEKNPREPQGNLQRQFRPGQQGGTPQAYQSRSGEALPTTGDDEAPWLKTPPFATEIVPWYRDLPIPGAGGPISGDYLALRELECWQQRLLQVYMRLQIPLIAGGNATCQLSLIAEGLARGNWHVMGVVDPTVTQFVPAGSARFPYSLGSRTFSPAELRTEAFVLAAGGTVAFFLTFDVAAYEAFRLNIRDLGAADDQINLFSADYAFAQ